MAGFFDERSQGPRVPQEIVHPLSQPLAIPVVVHGPSVHRRPLHTVRSVKHHRYQLNEVDSNRLAELAEAANGGGLDFFYRDQIPREQGGPPFRATNQIVVRPLFVAMTGPADLGKLGRTMSQATSRQPIWQPGRLRR